MNSKKINIEDLPLVLSVKHISEILGLSLPFCYELFRSKDFPSIRIAKRWVVKKDQFFEWLDKQSEIQRNADWRN